MGERWFYLGLVSVGGRRAPVPIIWPSVSVDREVGYDTTSNNQGGGVHAREGVV